MMTAMQELRRATDLVPANLRAAARKVLSYQELYEGSRTDDGAADSFITALDLWQTLTGVVDPVSALAVAREIAADAT